ncbi:MAG: DSD1 family PLP-dependent enzyme [Acidobacteriota bacterium]
MVQTLDDIPTPALLLDLDAFEANLSRMLAHVTARGRALRPHGKSHKCPEIAKRLVAAGAVGACAAKLSEAEVFAVHGIRGLLVTTAVVGRAKIARAVDLTRTAPDTILCVDDPDNVRDLNDAARAASVSMNLAVDLYFGRTGVPPGQPALALAELIASLSHVRFAGLQAYDAEASHTVGFDARAARTRQTMGLAVATRRLIEQRGLACPMVSGGSTGTYAVDAEIEGVTELQPGSFIFMDMAYARIGGASGLEFADFERALTVLTTVISTHADTAIVDGGYKAFATDRPFAPEPVDLAGASYAWAGDEHGRLDLSRASRRVGVGERIRLAVPHCDPTVNLYDQFYVLRDRTVEATWPVAARGKSQ